MEVHGMDELEPIYFDDFEKIRCINECARQDAAYKVNETISIFIGILGSLFRKRRNRTAGGVPQ